MTGTTLHNTWLPLTILAIACAGALVGFHEGLMRLHGRWTDEYSYSHGYLVLAMAGWLGYITLQQAGEVEVRGSVWGWLGLVGVTTLYTITYLIDLTIGMQILIPAILLCLIAALWGLRAAWLLLFPVGFLYFAIPIWDLCIGTLQKLATIVATNLLPLFRINAFIEGSYIETSRGAFEIGDACAGLRFFIVGLTLAVFYGLISFRTWRARILLVALAVGVSLIANWIRVVSLIMIGHYTDMQHYLIQQEHYLYGWVIFAVAMTPLFWLAHRMEPAAAAAPAERPRISAPFPRRLLGAGLIAAAVVASPALVRNDDAAPETRALSLDTSGSGWRAGRFSGTWTPTLLVPGALLQAAYVSTSGSASVDVLVARYGHQSGESKAISTRNRLEGGYQIIEQETGSIGQAAHPANVFKLTQSGHQRLVWYWYYVGGKRVLDTRRGKLEELMALLRGRRDAAIVAVSVDCSPSCDDAQEAADAFVSRFHDQLQALANTTQRSDPG